MWLPFSQVEMNADQSLWSLPWVKLAADTSLWKIMQQGELTTPSFDTGAAETKPVGKKNSTEGMSIHTIEPLLVEVEGSSQWTLSLKQRL